MKPFLNASEVARLLNVDRATVIRWIKRGILKADRIEGTRHWRISLPTYEEFIKNKPNV
jgi:excisionase family DNA binding protein